jgi:single-strand DNA-binding protein
VKRPSEPEGDDVEGLNKVMLIGSLGLDPELKYISNGNAVLRLRMATSKRWMKDGQKQEKTEWHTVMVWGKRAEALNKILHKGKSVYVEGELQTRQWDDKDGNKRSTTEIVASEILLLGGPRDGGERGERQSSGGPRQRTVSSSDQGYPGGGDQNDAYGDPNEDRTGDDIPF